MKLFKYILTTVAILSVVSCNDDFLELQPTDKVSANDLFSSPEGVKTFMAGLYFQLPIEDFAWDAKNGFNFNPGDANNAGWFPFLTTEDAIGSEWDNITIAGGGDYEWWDDAYKLNKDINLLFEAIPELDITQEEKQALYGEASFMRAYTYFGLAKRYGGVPIITEIGDIDDLESLNVPRNTEKETWDFILASCDSAANNLGDGNGDRRRATKWVSLALKSRVALHAASLAKYWDEAPLSGSAVDLKLVGMNASDADEYYAQCISASKEIIDSEMFSLYQASPANADEATENYRLMFEDPNNAMNEVMFMRGYTLQGVGYGANWDNWGNPAQAAGAWPHPGRFCPTLDLVDTYEDYSNPGFSAPIATTVDGDVTNYDGYDATRTYIEYDHPTDIFVGKDARLRATTILPGSMWKDIEIIIQGGYIQPDGTPVIEAPGEIDVAGTMYYTYGASTPKLYSGFSTVGGNMTKTGFGFKKFLNSAYIPQYGWNFSTTDWIDFRYAEVLLNYAEAVAESGTGDAVVAAKAINDIRKRAAHTADIPLTLENVLRERRVELVYENKRIWDLVRRRTYHTTFFDSYRHSLVPVFDLRTMKYIFLRKNAFHTNPRTYIDAWYYKAIPGIGSNGLTQNPQY